MDTSNDAVALLSVLNMGEAKIIIMCRGWESNVLLFSSRDPGTRRYGGDLARLYEHRAKVTKNEEAGV